MEELFLYVTGVYCRNIDVFNICKNVKLKYLYFNNICYLK